MKHSILTAFSTLVLSGLTASAGLISSTNVGGHSYELWESSGISWADANTAATSSGGYLATLTTETETSAVYNAFIGNGFFVTGNSQAIQAWLGGYTTDAGFSTTSPENWAWVTGEAWTPFAILNFGAGEPNGDSSGLTINRFGTVEWNDEGGLVGGYIVEYGAVAQPTNLPDSGSTTALLAGGLALIGFVGRKARR